LRAEAAVWCERCFEALSVGKRVLLLGIARSGCRTVEYRLFWGVVESAGTFESRWLEAAARVAALCDALRVVPAQLEPCFRAKMQAVREQIYFVWEKPRGGAMVAGKYECDG
jgi:hypothetical protein